MTQPVLVVIRGNSSSGKTSVAREIRGRYGRGCALIEQDEHRRIVLREHETTGLEPAAPRFIADTVRSALRAGYHVVLEGILYAEFYAPVLRQLIAEHRGPSHVFYFDIPLTETLRRHQARAASVKFTAEEMTGWYRERDLLGVDGEHVIGADATLEDTVATILHHSGLAHAAPQAPCPTTCPRCAEKASMLAPRPPATGKLADQLPPGAGAAAPLVVAALAIVPTEHGQVLFVRQQRGPYAGELLLPGGTIKAGEAFEDAARRETLEEANVEAGALTPVGVYDITATTPAGGYRFVMFVFRAGSDSVRVRDGGHHVDAVVVADPADVRPYPTVRRILTDAGVAGYDQAAIDRDLHQDGITMRSYPIGAAQC
nr:hypothetical protein GCM10020063_009700 [Dactylosporangium thailandense]